MANTDAPRVVRPVEIMWAFWLLVASVAVSIVVGLLNLTTPAYVEQMGRGLQIDHLDPVQVHEMTQGSYRTETAVGLVLVALVWLWLAFLVRAGRNGARVVVVVMWLLSVVDLSAFVPGYPTVVSQVLAEVPVSLTVAAIVAMFRPEASVYFRGRKQPGHHTGQAGGNRAR